jgi:selenoprotein W-related protein
MTEVEIEYCVPCGYRGRAMDVERAILGALERDLERVSLVTSDHGVFRVSVDGETVYDEAEDQYDVDGIVREIRERL